MEENKIKLDRSYKIKFTLKKKKKKGSKVFIMKL